MNKIFDRTENEIDNILPRYFSDLIAAKILDKRGFNIGLSRYLNTVPNISADYPKLGEYLSNLMIILYN